MDHIQNKYDKYIRLIIGRVFISLIFLLSGFSKISNYEGTVPLDGIFKCSQNIFLIPAIVLEIIAPIFIIIGFIKLKSQQLY